MQSFNQSHNTAVAALEISSRLNSILCVRMLKNMGGSLASTPGTVPEVEGCICPVICTRAGRNIHHFQGIDYVVDQSQTVA